MADEAFALSPISARAAEPREEDYDAISAAFMETSRGRWFLTEYAKRNRNADTRMVLDAVARIEQNIAAQKPLPSDNSLAEARLAEARLAEARLAEARLAEALTAVRGAVDAFRSAASGALDGLAVEEKLKPLRKGARIIREIAWRWREIGADSRICDLLDAQVQAIEASCDELASLDARTAFDAAFDLMRQEIDGLVSSDTNGNKVSSASTETRDSSPPTPAHAEPLSSDASDENGAAPLQMAEAGVSSLDETDMPEPALAEATAHAGSDADVDEYDETILDAVALEMAIADPIEPKRAPVVERPAPSRAAKFDEIDDVEIHFIDSPEEPPIAEPAFVAQKIVPPLPIAPQQPMAPQQTVSHESLILQESVTLPTEPPQAPVTAPAMETARTIAAETAPEFSPKPAPEPAMKPRSDVSSPISFELPPESFHGASVAESSDISLGSSLIASGIVKKPGKTPASDPMAPIRRLSQAEKIALFS